MGSNVGERFNRAGRDPQYATIGAMAALALTAAMLGACRPLTPQTFVVNSTVDAVDAAPGDGVCETATPNECTLRAAVMEASAAAPSVQTTITLGANTTYTLSLVGSDDAGAVGDLDVTGHVHIVGNGATISGNSQVRVFDLHAGQLIIDQATVSDGITDSVFFTPDGPSEGGGILNRGDLQLRDVTLTGHGSDTGGAAVHQIDGSTSLTRVRAVGN